MADIRTAGSSQPWRLRDPRSRNFVVGIICFAYSTVLTGHTMENGVWSILQEKRLASLSARVYCCGGTCTCGVFGSGRTAADIFNALMAVPNLTAVLLLSGTVGKETEKYIHDLDQKEEQECDGKMR